MFWDKKLVRDYLVITAGAFVLAAALDAFLVPNKIAAGGVSGLATIIYYLTGFPVGWCFLLLNIPLFVLSYRELGAQVVVRSLYGAVATSLFVELLAGRIGVPTRDNLLAAFYGGILAGLGMGLVLRARGTTGGTDLVARLVHKYLPVTVGQALLGADFFVISLAGLVFNAELALYALLALLATSKVIDLVQEGVSYAKTAFIISRRPAEIAAAVFRELDRGVTAVPARGMYTGEEKTLLLVVVAKTEETRLKQVIYETDPEAFVFIANAHEVLGEGFRKVENTR